MPLMEPGTGLVTQGFGNADWANISNIVAASGIMLGAASPVENGNRRFDPGSNWTAPIYSCATTIKVYIMDVSFIINGTSDLANLKIFSAVPRNYTSNDTTPLWAVENTGMLIGEVDPFWAVVDDQFEDWPSLWTVRKDHMYLPAGRSIFDDYLGSTTSHASAEAPGCALGTTYSSATRSSSTDGLPDYSSASNYPLYLKWQNLSRTAETSSTIINLIWTDIMANYVVGTRSNIGAYGSVSSNSSTHSGPLIRVGQFNHAIQYQMVYAIPAFIFLFIYLVVLIASIIMLVRRRVGFRTLKSLLNRTTVGRAITTERHGHTAGVETMSTAKWIETYGMEDVGIRKKLGRSETGFKSVKSVRSVKTESLSGKSDRSENATIGLLSPSLTPQISEADFKIKRKPLLRQTGQRYEMVENDLHD
jgi:hypothetical protein